MFAMDNQQPSPQGKVQRLSCEGEGLKRVGENPLNRSGEGPHKRIKI
nr:MAG TPA: hypothetical protein [Caudoviricetes sp.]